MTERTRRRDWDKERIWRQVVGGHAGTIKLIVACHWKPS
jgi:hypothetical protein